MKTAIKMSKLIGMAFSVATILLALAVPPLVALAQGSPQGELSAEQQKKSIYDGVATLDANGEAIVELPESTRALKCDYRYMLTALGAPMPDLYVAEEIANNRFKVAGGVTGKRVSWQVTRECQESAAIQVAKRETVGTVPSQDAKREKTVQAMAAGQQAPASEKPAPEPQKQEEPIFVTLQKDPYMKRYGAPPGEGWIPLPGTRTEVRPSGFIQLNIIHDFQKTGIPGGFGWFVPALISVPTDHTPNTTFEARWSRVDFETRTNVEKVGSVRTMFDIDFFGSLTSPLVDSLPEPRLRQAYVTWVGPESKISFTVGRAWDTFTDLQVWPEIFDGQGPNAMSGTRQGLVKGSYAFGKEKDLIFAASIEQPITLVQNGTGVRGWPDFSAQLGWQRSWGHLQGMALARQLEAQSTAGTGRDSAFGWGLSFSGSFYVPGTLRKYAKPDNLGPRQDKVQFQVQGGQGIGRYILDPSTTVVSLDAVYDPATGTLTPISDVGAFAAYHHWWTNRLRSQFVYSVVHVGNTQIQTPMPYSFDLTRYAVANLAYRAFSRMDVGVEYYYGMRQNLESQRGRANRLLFGFNFMF